MLPPRIHDSRLQRTPRRAIIIQSRNTTVDLERRRVKQPAAKQGVEGAAVERGAGFGGGHDGGCSQGFQERLVGFVGFFGTLRWG